MKKIISALLLVFLVASFAACGDNQSSAEARIEKYSGMQVDISVNEDGRYALRGDTYVCFDRDNAVINIIMEDPYIVGYKVSSAWDGGVYILKQSSAATTLETLNNVADELRAAGNDTLADQIGEAIDTIESAGPYSGAST